MADKSANKFPTAKSIPQSPKLFITHAWEDLEFVRRLSTDLSTNGFEGFVDIYSIRLGDVIPAEIARGLESCDVYLPILSQAALQSSWCIEEINAALALSNEAGRNGRPRIISVLIEDCHDAIPLFLRMRLHVNFEGRYEGAFGELLTKGFNLPGRAPYETKGQEAQERPIPKSR